MILQIGWPRQVSEMTHFLQVGLFDHVMDKNHNKWLPWLHDTCHIAPFPSWKFPFLPYFAATQPLYSYIANGVPLTMLKYSPLRVIKS